MNGPTLRPEDEPVLTKKCEAGMHEGGVYLIGLGETILGCRGGLGCDCECHS